MNLKYENLMVRPQSSRLKLCCEYVVLQVGKISVVDAFTTERVFLQWCQFISAGRVPYLGGWRKLSRRSWSQVNLTYLYLHLYLHFNMWHICIGKKCYWICAIFAEDNLCVLLPLALHIATLAGIALLASSAMIIELLSSSARVTSVKLSICLAVELMQLCNVSNQWAVQ